MVEVLESSFVVPSDETPKGRLWLSNLDQIAPRGYVGTVNFYNKTEATNFFSVEKLKAALSKVLVLFYPLAGRHVVGSDGRIELDCNAEGCLFVRAQLERTFDSINVMLSNRELEDLFVPSVEMAGSSPVMLMIQMTNLKCGGVALGFAFYHVFGDGRGCTHFIKTWAKVTRGDLSSILLPSFDQTPLRARPPPIIKFDHREHAGTVMPTGSTTIKFRLSKAQISSLKSRSSIRGDAIKPSSFCAVTSLIWKCYCHARGLAPDTTTHLMITMDVSGRLNPPLPKHHFSNAIVQKCLQSKVSKITSNSLHAVAKYVKAAVDSVNDEYVRSFIDYIEIARNDVLMRSTAVYKSHLRVVSILGMPIYDADFGWGAPEIVSRWKVNGDSVVYISDEPGENGGIEVVVTIDSVTMNHFEKMFQEELNANDENNSSIGTEIGPIIQIGRSK